MRRAVIVAVGAALVVTLFFVLRDSDEDSESTDTTTTSPTTTSPTTTGRTTATRPKPPGPTLIRIRVRGGRVVGGLARARLERGDRAVLVVSADVSDHVHLHGYNKFADVAPGRPARLRFRATIPGRFEAELEDRRLQILALEVRP